MQLVSTEWPLLLPTSISLHSHLITVAKRSLADWPWQQRTALGAYVPLPLIVTDQCPSQHLLLPRDWCHGKCGKQWQVWLVGLPCQLPQASSWSVLTLLWEAAPETPQSVLASYLGPTCQKDSGKQAADQQTRLLSGETCCFLGALNSMMEAAR